VFVVLVVVSTDVCCSLCFSRGGSWIWVMEVWSRRCGFWWFFSTATTLLVVFAPATVLVVVHCYGDGCFGGGSFFCSGDGFGGVILLQQRF
jgi:hypothetical protein